MSETLPRTDRPRRSPTRRRLLTSERNRQNRPRKWRHSSVRELAHRIIRTAALDTRKSDRRYLFQKKE